MNPLIPLLFSLPAAYLSTFLFRRIALLCNVMDVPDHRKIHLNPMPLLGGLAVYVAVILGVAFAPAVLRHIPGILAGATVILIIGVVDDFMGLPAAVKLTGQLVAAAIMIYSGVRVSFFPDTWAGYGGEIILTLVWVAGITNAVNYLDGIDGLAAGSTAISAAFFVIVSYITEQPLTGMTALILLAGCLGFLPHNFKRARIFLGDAGSTFLGFMLAGIALAGNWAEDNILRLSIPVLILGVPIFDMTFTTVMRIREKKVGTVMEWLEYGGKDHFHHRLVALGLRPAGAVFFIWFISIALGISAIIITYAEKRVEGIWAIIQAAVIFGVIAVLMVVGARRRSGRNIPDGEG